MKRGVFSFSSSLLSASPSSLIRISASAPTCASASSLRCTDVARFHSTHSPSASSSSSSTTTVTTTTTTTSSCTATTNNNNGNAHYEMVPRAYLVKGAFQIDEPVGFDSSPTIKHNLPDFHVPHLYRWKKIPRNILIVKKQGSDKPTQAMKDLIAFLRDQYKYVNIIVEPTTTGEFEGVYYFHPDIRDKIDFVITLGGDGTILHVSSLFSNNLPGSYTGLVPPASSTVSTTTTQPASTTTTTSSDAVTSQSTGQAHASTGTSPQLPQQNLESRPIVNLGYRIPPVLSFSLGSLGFLMPFDFANFKETVKNVMDIHRPFRVTHRVRLEVEIIRQAQAIKRAIVMNEVAIHRGGITIPTNVNVRVNNFFLTKFKGDGLLVATPTGSTGYSLSSGGSMVHPTVDSLLLTPVCARSLSFRPMILPSFAEIELEISEENRTDIPAVAAFDGRDEMALQRHDKIVVRKSLYTLPTIDRMETVSDWLMDVNQRLKFNTAYEPPADEYDRYHE